jgi:hypothetical protein
MLLVVAIVGAAVFSLIGERESKVDISGFGDDDLQVTEFETANDGNLSVQVRHLDRETASIKSVNLSTDTGDKQLSVKGDKDVGSVDANSFQLCSKTGNITAEEATLEIVYDGQFNDLISEGELSGDINIKECSSSSSTGSAFFNVSITDVNNSVTEGETVYVDYEVNNSGDAFGEQEVNLTVNESSIGEVDNTTISLDSGGNTTGTFNWPTSDGDAGDYNLTVASKDDSDSTTTTLEPATHIIDDFEDGNLTEYTVVEDNSDVSVSAQSSNVISGGYSLSIKGDEGSGEALSTSGLNYYPKRNDTIKFNWTFEDVNAKTLTFGWAQNSNWFETGYTLGFGFRDGQIKLSKRNSGSNTNLDSKSVSWSNHDDEIITTKIAYGSSDIDVSLEKSGNTFVQLSATDTDHETGGIMLFGTWDSAGDPRESYLIDDIKAK